MNEPEYVYQGVTKGGKVISLPTEAETILALEKAGGGVYKNTLHRYKFTVGRKP